MPLQDHIHIAATVDTTGEKAPPLKWRVRSPNRIVIPIVFMRLRRSLNTSLRKNIATDEDGIIRLTNFRYKIALRADYGYTLQERVDQLMALNGVTGYLCDSIHANDGADHTADVKPYVIQVREFVPEDPGLQHYTVDVDFEDASR
jgi:hypothetical protein